jgi:hypothetical protein
MINLAIAPDGKVVIIFTEFHGSGSPQYSVLRMYRNDYGLQSNTWQAIASITNNFSQILSLPASQRRKIQQKGNLAYDISPGNNRGRLYLAYLDITSGVAYD